MNGDSSKKVSFGFSKVSKKSNIVQSSNKKDDLKVNEVQYIECLEEKSIKIIGNDEKEKPLPVITMRNGNQLKDSIQAAVNLRAKKNVEQSFVSGKLELPVDKMDVAEDELNITEIQEVSETISVPTTSDENINAISKKSLTLDELAAKEILEDIKHKQVQQEKDDSATTVSLASQDLVEQKESTLEDYETMPINDFGLAMLRGMGWDPKKGIGLKEQIVTPSAPTLRPKGMGLGADKVPTAVNVTTNGEVLVMKKEAPVKILTGLYSNSYGKVAGFDELPGRIMVRLAKNNVVISLNELMIQLVSTNEYKENLDQLENVNVKPEKQQTTDQVYGLNVKDKKEEKIPSRENVVAKTYTSGKDERKGNKKEELSSDSDSNRKRRKHRKQASDSSDSSPNREVRKSKTYYRSRDDDRYEKSRGSRQRKRRSSSTSSSRSSTSEYGKYGRSSSYRYNRQNNYFKPRNYQDRSYRFKKTFRRNRGSFSNDSEGNYSRNYYSRKPHNRYYNR